MHALALPIARRELLVLSRASATWRGRLGTSAMVFVFGIFMAMMYRYAGQVALTQVMHLAGVGLSLMALFAGAALTADSIAEEKRAGTIGLLFLTHLSPFEIVMGKLVAHSVAGFYSLLCAMPLLSMSMIFGGMRLRDVLVYVLSAMNVLFFSATVGLFASSLCRDKKRAGALGILILMFFWLGLPSLALLLNALKAPHWLVEVAVRLGVNLFPSFGLGLGRLLPSTFSTGWSLAWTHFLAWSMIGLTVWVLPRRWQETPPRKRIALWDLWKAISLGTPGTRLKLRQKLLDRNAFMWLASRDRLQAAGPWLVSLSILGFLGLLFSTTPWDPGKLVVIAGCLAITHQIAFSGAAGTQLFREYEQGTLEMVLSTPLSVHEVIQGQMDATLRHHRRFFVFVFVLLWAAIVWLFLTKGSRQMTGLGVLIVYSGLFMLQCHAMGWVGMWSIVTAPNPRKSNVNAFFYITISPLIIFGFIIVSAQFLNWLTGTKFSAGPKLLLPLLFALAFGVCIYWLRRAQRELPTQLRLFAFRRYTPQERPTLFVILGRFAGRLLARKKVTALKAQ